MERYFKIVEISEEEFEKKTWDSLDGCSQIVCTEDDGVYVGIDDEEDDSLYVDISSFNYCEEENTEDETVNLNKAKQDLERAMEMVYASDGYDLICGFCKKYNKNTGECERTEDDCTAEWVGV